MRAGAAVSWSAFFSTYLPALVLALGTGIALPALPALAQSFGVGFGLASGVVTAFLLGNLAGTIPSGYFIDRFGRRPMLIAGPLLSSAIAFLVVGSTSFPELLVLRFFNGFATQMWVMARLAAISENSEPGQRGRLVSWMYGMDNTGKLAGPMLGGFIASAWGVRAPFLVYACLALLALIPTMLASQNDRSERKADRVAVRPRLPAQPLHKIVLPRLAFFSVSLFAGLTRGPIDADLLHLYAAFAYHLSARQIGYLATSAAVLSWPIGLLAGWLLDRFGRRFSTIPGFAGLAVAMIGLAVCALLQLAFFWYVALFLIGIALYALTSGS